MTRWTSPQHGKKKEIDHGQFNIGAYIVGVSEVITNLTVNMYGHVDTTSEFKFRILEPESRKFIEVVLPGSFKGGLIMERKRDVVLGLCLEEKRYFDPCSNALEKIRRHFLLKLKTGELWVYDNKKWKRFGKRRRCFSSIRAIARLYRVRRIRDFILDGHFRTTNTRNNEDASEDFSNDLDSNSLKYKFQYNTFKFIYFIMKCITGCRIRQLRKLKQRFKRMAFDWNRKEYFVSDCANNQLSG